MARTIVLWVMLATLLAAPAYGQLTRTWEQHSFDDFEKGTSHGVAIRSDGVLELGPEVKPLATLPSTYLWTVASDSAGNLYAAGGVPAAVYRITPDGHYTVLLAPSELQVQALAIAPDGSVYAATSPDGRVYHIVRAAPGASHPPAASNTTGLELDPSYSSSVFYEPGTKYIWALAFDLQGRLYLATGDNGQIFRVEKDGKGSQFFKSDEAHIRCLTFDAKGNLIAGSDGSGLIYRISPSGDGFVLYSAPRNEITALAVDRQGNIFAAASGERRTQPGATPAAMPMTPPSQIPGFNPQISPSFTALAAAGSEVYRIAPDGSPRREWSSREDIVYAFAFDGSGRLLAGTGNRGRVYTLAADGFTDLTKASAGQVIGFAPAPGGALYAATSNLGKIFLVAESGDHEGTYESEVFDAHNFSRFGRVELRGHGSMEIFVHSGNVDNPDRNWSAWHRVDSAHDASVNAPSARFVQWRAVLHRGAQLDSVVLNYLPRNIAPEVDEVAVMVGSKFQIAPRMVTEPGPAQLPIGHMEVPIMPTRDRDYIAVRWAAHDDNDDQLTFSVYYRGDNETNWMLLRAGIADRFFSFPSDLLPDGGYIIRVVASDAPSHAPDDALTGSHESPRFEVDNTPPVIENLAARLEPSGIRVTFRAVDGFSPINHAEYSLDAGDWQFVAPVGAISDSRSEEFNFTVPVPHHSAAEDGDEHLIVVRVYDRYENVTAGKVVVRPGAR